MKLATQQHTGSSPSPPLNLASLKIYFPVERLHELVAHVRAEKTTISARARELLMNDIAGKQPGSKNK